MLLLLLLLFKLCVFIYVCCCFFCFSLEVPVASKSFFKSESVNLKWSPLGNALLIESSTSTDSSGKSYYGESNLHLLFVNNSFSGTVSFGTNAGPVQDAAWSPTGKEFVVIQGFQPAKCILYRADTCTAIREYCSGSYNTIRWSPHGRFLVLGGFGNLAGEFTFWDHLKFKKIGQAQHRTAKIFEWTPDSRNFITAVTRPRRVDNGLIIWTYYGEQIKMKQYEILYQLYIQPASVGIYPNRPQSPHLIEKRKQQKQEQKDPATIPVPVKSAYIPPHLRAAGLGASNLMKIGREDTGPKKLTNKPPNNQNQNSKPTNTDQPQVTTNI
jgi:translation initiation factor 2A